MDSVFAATTFFLSGLISGGLIMTHIIFKLYGIYDPKNTEDEEERESQPQKGLSIEVMEIPLGQMIKKNMKKVNPVLVSEEKIRSIVDKRLDYLKENEHWVKLSKTNEIAESIFETFEERKEWFVSRIGKKITTSNITCDCPECTQINESGTILQTKDNAYTSFLHEIYNKLELKDFEYIDYEV